MPTTLQPSFPVYSYPLYGRTLTTAAGTNQATATAVTAAFTDINAGTTAGTGGVILPAQSSASLTPVPYTVANFTGFGAYVWPPLGAAFVGYGTNVPYALAPWSSNVFVLAQNNLLQWNVSEPYSIPTGTVPV